MSMMNKKTLSESDSITPPDEVPPTDDGEAPLPPEPGDDETVVDGYPPLDITLPPGVAEPPAKYYRFPK